MKKQINKVLIALIFSTVIAPAYGSFGTDLAAIAGGTGVAFATALLAVGTCGGAAALIGKTIIDRFFPKKNDQENNEQQPNQDDANNRNTNVIISGCIGGILLNNNRPLLGALLGTGSAYLCNEAYDRVFGKENRDYNSSRTTFISGAMGAAAPTVVVLTMAAMAILPTLVIMAGIGNAGR